MSFIDEKVRNFFGMQEPETFEPEPATHIDKFDPKILQMRIKRKHQMELIRQMLQEGGYGDLAKMTSLSKRDYDADVED